MFKYVLEMPSHCYTNLTPGEHIITNYWYSTGTECLMISLSLSSMCQMLLQAPSFKLPHR